MSDTLTDNFELTKISRRKGWASDMNANMDRLGKLFCVDNAGDFWIVQNAIYDPATDTWSQTDTGNASTAVRMKTDGSTTMLKCAAGTPTITWSSAFAWNDLIFPDGFVDFQGMDLQNIDEITVDDFCGLYRLTVSGNVALTHDFSTPLVLTVSAPNDTEFRDVPGFEVIVPPFVVQGSTMRFTVNLSNTDPHAPYYFYFQLLKNDEGAGYLTNGLTNKIQVAQSEIDMYLDVPVVGGDVFTMRAELYCASGYTPATLTIHAFKAKYNSEKVTGMGWSV